MDKSQHKQESSTSGEWLWEIPVLTHQVGNRSSSGSRGVHYPIDQDAGGTRVSTQAALTTGHRNQVRHGMNFNPISYLKWLITTVYEVAITSLAPNRDDSAAVMCEIQRLTITTEADYIIPRSTVNDGPRCPRERSITTRSTYL